MAQPNKTAPLNTEYLKALEVEKAKVDQGLKNTSRLLDEEIDRIKSGRSKEKLTVEVHHGKPVKMGVKVLIPVKEFPKFNFVGKLLGPKGNSLKRLQEETGCKMFIFGKGSMRDRNKEEELRKEGGKYAHLNEELHCLVEVFAPPQEGFRRLSHSMAELQRFLIPDVNDEIRMQQLEELGYDQNGEEMQHSGQMGPPTRGRGGRGGRGGAPPPAGRGRGGAPLLATPSARGAASRGRGAFAGAKPAPAGGRGGLPAARPAPQPARPAPPQPRQEYQEEQYYGATSYEDQSYAGYGEQLQEYADPYDQSYTAGAGDTQYFDYGHSSTTTRDQTGYEEYAEEAGGWGNGQASYGKAPAPRPRPGPGGVAERPHPYPGAQRPARY